MDGWTFRRRAAIWALALVVLFHLGWVLHKRVRHAGDFDVHRAFALAFFSDEPLYGELGDVNYMYLPISGLYCAPLIWAPANVAFVGRYLAAVGCTVWCAAWLTEMVRRGRNPHALSLRAAGPTSTEWIVLVCSVAAAAHYLLRDLDDAGPHLLLLTMMLGAMRCFDRGRIGWGATWLGLATALKVTPVLFVPFFVWKREWKAAGATLAATACWLLLPLPWMGPTAWVDAHRQWSSVAFGAFGERDAKRLGNEAKSQNQNLRDGLRQLLDERTRREPQLTHPGYGALAVFPEPAARLLSWAAVLAVTGICMAASWGAYRGPGDPRRAVEAAGVLVLILLLSPITWIQHMPWAWPAIFLVSSALHDPKRVRPRWASVCVGIFLVLSLGLNREFLGRENYLLMLHYQIHTVCLLLVLGTLLGLTAGEGATLSEGTRLAEATGPADPPALQPAGFPHGARNPHFRSRRRNVVTSNPTEESS